MADPATILVVDDLNPTALEKLLAADGYRVLMADSGPAALSRLRQEHVDLVLLDIVMPGMDGYEVLSHIRAQYGDRVSVLLASAQYTESADVVRGLQIGADDYVSKPFDYAELRARIATKLKQRRLENELRAAQRAAEAQNDLLRRVLGIVQAATSSLDPDVLTAAVHQGLHEDLGLGRAAIWRAYPQGGSLTPFPPEALPLPQEAVARLRAGEDTVRLDGRLLVAIRLNAALVGILDMDWLPEWPEGVSTILKALADSLAILYQTTRYVRQIARENTLHELLNQLASRDASLAEMVTELRHFLNTHLLLINRWFNLLVSEPVPAFVEDGQVRPAIVEYYQSRGLMEEIARRRRPLVVEAEGEVPFHRVFPVLLGGEVTALVITLPPEGATRDTLAPQGEMERAARFLAGVLQRRREADLREQRLRAEFVTDFLSGRLANELGRSDLFLYASKLGLNLAQPAFVARIELSGFDELVDIMQPRFEQRVDELLDPLLREAQAAREAMQLGGLEVPVGKSVIAIVSLPAALSEEQARQSAKLWAHRVLDSYRHRAGWRARPAIGLGRVAKEWRALPRSASEADRALRWALSNAQSQVAYYGDLGSERLLAAISDREELTRFHDEQLLPLIAYDAERDGQLLRTLELFYASGGQITRAAQSLSIHPNTLKYRLDQVAQLTGRDPRDPHVALDLQLALKIHGML